jgi:site-specific recombinase XerD
MISTVRFHVTNTLRMFFVRIIDWGWDDAPDRVPIVSGDLPRQDHPLPKALDDAAAAKFLRAAATQHRMLVRVVCEVLIRTGLRVSELINLDAGRSCRSAPGTGCTCRSANCMTTATCRCTRTSSS